MSVINGSVAVSIANASKKQDSANPDVRQGARGELLVIPMGVREHGLADEGSYFVNMNPTISTGVKLQGDTTTAWVATTPSILIVNTDVANQVTSKNIYFDYAKLLATAAGAGLSTLHAAVLIDGGNRYASGGTEVTANTKNANMTSNIASIAKIYYGATASAASAAVRQVGRAQLRAAIPVVGDQYILSFGTGEANAAGAVLNGTAPQNLGFNFAPVVIGPQQSLLIYLWAAAMSTSPSTEFELAWHER